MTAPPPTPSPPALRTVHADGGTITVSGRCDPRFTPLLDAFIDNFATRRELGAAVAVYLEGHQVVDLWGGHLDPARTAAWREDTIVGMASVVKGMMAFCLHLLADRGLLDYDQPVARYWPEFAENGKERITVRQAISHHAAIHFADQARAGDLFRWRPLVEAVAAQKPEWEPGTRGVYHTITIIPILGELIERVSGRSFLETYRAEITAALGVDYHVGLGPAELARYAVDHETEPFLSGIPVPPEVAARFFQASGNPATDLTDDERASMVFTGAGGTARGAARLFAIAAEDGAFEGRRIISPRTIDLMTEEQWYAKCAVWGTPMRVALGLLLNEPEFFYVGPNPKAFGTAGAGGSLAMADRQHRLSFGYAVNRWWPALALGDRARTLIDATYRCI
jgi:CubicO group peptidase (beta-lactamase class C family)